MSMMENEMIGMEQVEVPQDPFSRMDDGYYEMEAAVAKRATKLTDNRTTPLFTTSAEGLYDLYLANIPEGEARQHYTCNTCRHFIERFGNLALMDGTTGKLTSLLWDETSDEIWDFFKPAVGAMRRAVESARVTGVFLSNEAKLGIPKTGVWSHLHLVLPKEMVVRKPRYLGELNAEQQMAAKREDYRILMTDLQKYSYDTINTAIEQVLKSADAFRGERVLGAAESFRSIRAAWESAPNGEVRRNLVWYKVAVTPINTLHIGNSPVGELMDNLMAGMSLRTCAMKLSNRMESYQQSTSAPTENEAAIAEQRIEALGLTKALARKYLTMEQIPQEAYLWDSRKAAAPVVVKPVSRTNKPTGIFAGLLTREKQAAAAAAAARPGAGAKNDLNAEKITWAKFARTVLPGAVELEALTDKNARFAALVTAAYPEEESILCYGSQASWYYAGGGIDLRKKKLVERNGGMYENVQIRATLMWPNETPRGRYATDLDLHGYAPNGLSAAHIYYGCKSGAGGYLDIDANAAGERTPQMTDYAVENIRWASGAADGRYRFVVKNYRQKDLFANTFELELAVGDQVWTYTGTAGGTDWSKTVFEFDYRDGAVTRLWMDGVETAVAGGAGKADDWNVASDAFVKVKAVVTSPNLWGDKTAANIGTHTFFLLEGCKDKNEGAGKGFHNEALIPELKDKAMRKTLTAYTALGQIDGVEEADACGLGYSTESDWNLVLRVRLASGVTKTYLVDRYD